MSDGCGVDNTTLGFMAAVNNDKLAVLIDADNAQASIIRELLVEVSRYGTANVKRAYGNWTTPQLTSWKEVLHAMAIQPMQQFSYTTGKNATDSSLIIDAMDLLYAGNLNGFCLVSSDSDFTRLATRIRESGLLVYGFGTKKTPEAFVAACNKFIFTEILKPSQASIVQPKQVQTVPSEQALTSQLAQVPKSLESMIRAAVTAAARDSDWAHLGAVGATIRKNEPSFDARNYDYPKLSDLVREQKYLEVKEVPANDGSPNVHIHVRLRN